MRLSTYLATRLGCPDLTPRGQLDCLQNMDRDSLEDSINWGSEETLDIQKILRPTGVVDGDFLPDIPTKEGPSRKQQLHCILGFLPNYRLFLFELI